MTSYLSIGSNISFGNVTGLFLSTAFTAGCSSLALSGLNKINVVFGRGINASLEKLGWDTSSKDNWSARLVSCIPTHVSNLFKADVNYDKKVQSKDDKEQPLFADAEKKVAVMEFKVSNLYLLASGLALSVISLVALELKNAIWRDTNPLLNVVLKQISPLQLVLGESYIASAIDAGIGAVRSRIV